VRCISSKMVHPLQCQEMWGTSDLTHLTLPME